MVRKKQIRKFPLLISVLDRYFFVSSSVLFFISLVVFTSVLFLARSLKLMELVVSKNVPLSEILSLFSYIVPSFLELAIPMALFISITLFFGRLSADSELIAMRASGITLRRLAYPIVAFSVVVFVFALAISLYVRPWAESRLGIGMFELARTRAGAGLIAGAFNSLGRLTIYAEVVEDRGERLENVIVADQGSNSVSQVFFAKHGRLLSDEKTRTLIFQLYDGSIHEGVDPNYRVTYFDINNLSLEQDELVNDPNFRMDKKTKELPLGELTGAISEMESRPAVLEEKDVGKLRRMKVELQRRFAIPGACICVVLLAMALGVQPNRGEYSWGPGFSIAIGVLFIVFYYLFLAVATTLAEEGYGAAWLLCWLPNVGFLGVSTYLFYMVESEKWLALTQALGGLFAFLKSKVGNLFAHDT